MYVRGDGTLTYRGETYRCALGKGGLSEDKQEGDGCTPVGTYPVRACFYRPDRVEKPKTGLPVYEISPAIGWCDDPASRMYNPLAILPFQASHEKFWRDDPCYDLVVIIGYNDAPAVPGKGSAIFLHLAKEGYLPTEGCVAVSKEDMKSILSSLHIRSGIQISL